MAGYENYGISRDVVERVKKKMKNPLIKDQIKLLLKDLTKQDLQSKVKVRRLILSAAKILKEPMSEKQLQQYVQFIISQKIDPNNTFHLLKLWSVFR